MPSASENLDLLKPLDLGALDADKAFNLREKNNAPSADEAAWLEIAKYQHAAISAREASFFEELDRRMSAEGAR